MVKMLTMKELKLLRMLLSEDEYKDNLETSSMNTSLDAGLKLISSSSMVGIVTNKDVIFALILVSKIQKRKVLLLSSHLFRRA